MADTYTLRLINLTCVQAQEVDGDEVYMKLDDALIWSATEHHEKVHHAPDRARLVSEIDFEGGRQRGKGDWQPMDRFRAEDFVFAGLQGSHTLQLWDEDTFSRDDLLGTTPITAEDAGRGHITVVLARSGAEYRLTYVVE